MSRKSNRKNPVKFASAGLEGREKRLGLPRQIAQEIIVQHLLETQHFTNLYKVPREILVELVDPGANQEEREEEYPINDCG